MATVTEIPPRIGRRNWFVVVLGVLAAFVRGRRADVGQRASRLSPRHGRDGQRLRSPPFDGDHSLSSGREVTVRARTGGRSHTAVARRRWATLVAPAAVPLTMSAVFAVLGRCLPARPAHVAGFGVYWTVWCAAFPLWVLGRDGALQALRAGRRLQPAEIAVLALPVVGAVGTELLPRRHLVDRRVAAVMLGAAAVNAVGEELLWRATFLARFPDDEVRGAVWPLVGFILWHLAPQIVRPSARGRPAMLAGSAVVGAASTVVSWRCGGVRPVVVPHLLTDACGVRVARFWLGRPA